MRELLFNKVGAYPQHFVKDGTPYYVESVAALILPHWMNWHSMLEIHLKDDDFLLKRACVIERQ
ncbi:hypothetical protein NTGHW29_130039 [Candidatus Nitrotoga sp. HW29]|nr:hypothetical protein NTGHW29_130039 [Candidatus Nitrotoga sp. HW29]